MNVDHVLKIRDGDAVKTFREFLSAWWQRVELDALLAPVEQPDGGGVMPGAIEHPDDVALVNPFAPVMHSNAAGMVEDFIDSHPRSHLAAILRPCEQRALIELQKRNRIRYIPEAMSHGHESFITIGVDCPGTFSLAEYNHRLVNHDDHAAMIQIGLDYELHESHISWQVREACQLCDWNAPRGVDITIGTIGITPQGYMLVIAHDEELDARMGLKEITDCLAEEEQIVEREVMVGKLADKRAAKRAALLEAHASQMDDITSTIAMFSRCTLCADCLDACPLYDGELTGMLGVGESHQSSHPLLAELVSVSHWLASCSGCGMCQESCEHNVTLTPVVTTLSHRIQHELNYKAGEPLQKLPWTV